MTDLSMGPHEFSSKPYFDLKRGIFPKEISVKGAMAQALEELLFKPIGQKNFIEQRLDALYLEYLTPQFILYGPGGEGHVGEDFARNATLLASKENSEPARVARVNPLWGWIERNLRH